jgi:hypothetical protein
LGVDEVAGNARKPASRVPLRWGEDIRQVREYLHPNSEHVIDWFHITMRLTVLQQQTKSLEEKQSEDATAVSKQLESIKHLL